MSLGVLAGQYDQVLCGTEGSFEEENNKLGKIAKEMPPINNQAPASWCAYFNITDLVNYHNYKEQKDVFGISGTEP